MDNVPRGPNGKSRLKRDPKGALAKKRLNDALTSFPHPCPSVWDAGVPPPSQCVQSFSLIGR